jgi:hypothetical protein
MDNIKILEKKYFEIENKERLNENDLLISLLYFISKKSTFEEIYNEKNIDNNA